MSEAVAKGDEKRRTVRATGLIMNSATNDDIGDAMVACAANSSPYEKTIRRQKLEEARKGGGKREIIRDDDETAFLEGRGRVL